MIQKKPNIKVMPNGAKHEVLCGMLAFSMRSRQTNSTMLFRVAKTQGRAATERFSAQLPRAHWIGPE